MWHLLMQVLLPVLQLNDAHVKLGAEDGLAFGAVNPVMALELVAWLHKVRYDGHIYYDTFPRKEDPVREAEYNIRRFKVGDSSMQGHPMCCLLGKQTCVWTWASMLTASHAWCCAGVVGTGAAFEGGRDPYICCQARCHGRVGAVGSRGGPGHLQPRGVVGPAAAVLGQ